MLLYLKDAMCRRLRLTPCALVVELKAFQWRDNWGGEKQSLPRGFKLHHCIRLILHLIIHYLQMKALKLNPFILMFETKQIVG